MKQPAKNELATIEKQALSTMSSLPDYLQEAPTEPIRGGENVRREDIIMPRLQICSKQSPQFDENNEKHIDGLKLGQFFNTITRENYGDSVYAVPLFELNTRSRNRAYGEKGQPYCQSFDGKTGEGDPGGDCKTCKYSQWTQVKGKDKNLKPECTDSLNFAVMLMPKGMAMPENLIWGVLPRIDTISILGFKSTSFGKGQEWITMLRLRNRDWFTTVFKLTTVAKTDGNNSWHIPVPDNAGWLSREGADLSRPCYESIHDMYKSGRMKVDEQEREATDVAEGVEV